MKTSAIIFDLDGTLVDSAPDILRCLRSALVSQGITIPADLDRSRIGPPVAEIIERSGIRLSPEQKSAVIAVFRRTYDDDAMEETVPYPDVSEQLERLSRHGLPLFIATNKPLKPTLRVTERWFPGRFVECCCIDSLPGKKLTKTEMIRELLERHHLDPATTWVIGDGVSDMTGAIECGCRTMAVSYGYGASDELIRAGAERLVATAREWGTRKEFHD